MTSTNTDTGAPSALTRTLQRGLLILEILATDSRDSGLGVTEVAGAVGLDKATTNRLLQTLSALGYAYKDPDTRTYRLTGKLLRLAGSYQSNLEIPRRIRPFLQQLRDETRQTVHFGVREGDKVVYLLKLESPSPVLIASAVGQTMPIHTTALGKAILAAMKDVDAEPILAGLDFKPRTSRSIPDIKAFRQEMQITRQRGYSVDDRENQEAVTCVGSALVDSNGSVVGAISVSGPTFDVHDRVDELGRLCQGAALTIKPLL